MAKFCPECGTQTPSKTAKFCAECGTKFNTPAPAAIPVAHVPPAAPAVVKPVLPQQSYPQAYAVEETPPPLNRPTAKAANGFSGFVPKEAKGREAEELYKECIEKVRRKNPGAVSEFKTNCRAYGFSTITAEDFHSSLVKSIGKQDTIDFVPQLVRLIPSEEKRMDLMRCNENAKAAVLTDEIGTIRISDGSSATSASMGEGKSNPTASTGGIRNRYADHPNCDICNVTFEVTKRRHQCRLCGFYVCSSCSPARMLIPPGQEIKNAKDYQPNIPSRVCIHCAPHLEGVQAELAKTYGNSHKENAHEAKGRLHVPYSSSLEKECRNAADIIGNFFRPQWGAGTDRSIPSSFLEKAHGIAVMTIIKAGFLITGKIGTGLVIAKLPDGSWSAPSAIGTAGMGGGFEIGGEIVELMIILGSPGAVKVFHNTQVSIGAALDLTLGPYGRSAEVAAAASSSGLNKNYSYSHSKGLYGGISLQGAVIACRNDVNTKFYSRQVEPSVLLSGGVERPRAAQPLYDALDKAKESISEFRQTEAHRASLIGSCKSCGCASYLAHTTQIWNKKCKTCKHVH